MTSIGTGYDLYTSQFSPDGRVFQIDYAGKAVDNSGTAVALRGKDGVVFAVEKIVQSKLYEPDANKRIFSVDRHIGIAVSGLLPDGRALVDHAANECSSYRADFGSSVPIKYLVERISGYMHAYTLYSAVRPFGAAVMVGSWTSSEGAQLFCLEPSGAGCPQKWLSATYWASRAKYVPEPQTAALREAEARGWKPATGLLMMDSVAQASAPWKTQPVWLPGSNGTCCSSKDRCRASRSVMTPAVEMCS